MFIDYRFRSDQTLVGPHREAATFRDTAGDDVLVGGTGYDDFQIFVGGSDTASGGSGGDRFRFGTTFDATDSIDGGTGSDMLSLTGDYSDLLVIDADVMRDVEAIYLGGYFGSEPVRASGRFDLRLEGDLFSTKGVGFLLVKGNYEDALALSIDASTLVKADLRIQGSAGPDTILGGSENNTLSGYTGDDVLTGGRSDDVISGDTGSDRLAGGGGADVFVYQSYDAAKGAGIDTILDFSDGDRINLDQVGGEFHFADGGSHWGEISIRYQRSADVTLVRISTDADLVPELVIKLDGDHRDLSIADFIF